MKAQALLAAACALTLTAAAEPAADDFVHYVAAPVMDDGAMTAIAVEIRFRGDADGETRLALPEEWGGKAELWKQLEGLAVEGAQAREDGPAARILTHAPGAPIVVRYRVTSGYEGDPQVGRTDGNPYRPIVRPQWFSAIGQGVFAAPNGDRDRAADFRWGALPAGWRVASDLDHSAMGARYMVGDIQQSVMIGGPGLKLYEREVAGAGVRMAVLGDWSFEAADFSALIGRVLESHHDYWGSRGESFFVALTPLRPDEGSISIGGTGLDDAFALYAGTDTPLEPMRYLLAHEHLHTWVPRRLGNMPEGREEASAYWFSEGFTDFLTHRTLLRSGVWSLEEFAGKLNEELAAYAVSPSRTAPNGVIVERFWSDGDVQKLPYRRGMLLALLWDWRLSQATGGRRDLDEVLHAQARRQSQMRDAGETPIAHALFPLVYRESGGPELSGDIARFAERGEAVLLPETLFGDCARVTTVIRAKFARGWDPEATTAADNVVTGLRDDSPAYAAGLRNGMQIVKREFGKVGDSTVEYGLRITENGQERVIRFMPRAPGTEMVQQVVLAEGMTPAKRRACARRMSGG